MNLVGHRYGSLIIIEEIPGGKGKARMVKCQCDCGNIITIRKYSLSSGKKIPSCGCCRLHKYDDLIGRKFGKLVVLELSSRQDCNGHIHRIAKCQCDCGKTTMSYLSSLLHRNVHSCGCDHNYGLTSGANSNFFTGSGKISGTLIGLSKQNAKKHNLEFTIDLQYLCNLFEKQKGRCAFTGVQLVTCGSRRKITASLDRIDPTKGYIPDNVQWVHKIVNAMRNAFSINCFKQVCLLVAQQQGWYPHDVSSLPNPELPPESRLYKNK